MVKGGKNFASGIAGGAGKADHPSDSPLGRGAKVAIGLAIASSGLQ
jgi:hypothetical protein